MIVRLNAKGRTSGSRAVRPIIGYLIMYGGFLLGNTCIPDHPSGPFGQTEGEKQLPQHG